MKLEKEYHVKTEGKFGRKNSENMITAFKQSPPLYDKIYRELRLSDFKACVNNPTAKLNTKIGMVKLYKHMDTYAYSEDIIEKKYTDALKYPTADHNSRSPFTYEEIKYLWEINDNDYRVQFARDILLLAIYTGCRAEELLFIYTKNVFLDKNYIIAGLKTEAGTNRVIPIHPKIKPILEKYYNKSSEFLFISKNGKRASYAVYLKRYKRFKGKYTMIDKTAHCGRHTLETELQKLNVKQTIINSIIGHKNGNVASDVYNHVSLEEKIEAINLVTFETGKICIFKNKENVS